MRGERPRAPQDGRPRRHHGEGRTTASTSRASSRWSSPTGASAWAATSATSRSSGAPRARSAASRRSWSAASSSGRRSSRRPTVSSSRSRTRSHTTCARPCARWTASARSCCRTTARRSTRRGAATCAASRAPPTTWPGSWTGCSSSPGSTARSWSLEDVDLTELARAVVTDLREQDPDRTVDVLVEAGLHAEADPKMLRVVLVNLLGNAWKFTSRHETARIEVGAAQPTATRTEAEPTARVLRQGRRRRVRPALRAEPLRRLPAAAHARPVRGHRDRTRHRAAHRAPPRRHRLGRGRGREGRHLLVHAGAGRALTPSRARPAQSASGVASSSATRSSRDWRARMRSTSAPSRARRRLTPRRRPPSGGRCTAS